MGGSRVIRVTNIAPQATRDQMQTLFTFVGKVEEIKLYPTIRDVAIPVASRVSFVKFVDRDHVGIAQHLNNTVFIDRALIIVPYEKPDIPDEHTAMQALVQANGVMGVTNEKQLPAHVTNVVDGAYYITKDPTFAENGVPEYPSLPCTLEYGQVEEIRRTVVVGNLAPSTDANQVMEWLIDAGEIKYARMCGRDSDESRACLIEFSEQASVIPAVLRSGQQMGDRRLVVAHANQAIAKPQIKTNEMAQREIEEAMRRAQEQQSLISSTMQPVTSYMDDAKRSRSRERGRRRRSRSRDRRRRSRSRSPRRSRSRFSPGRDRRRSRSRDRKSRRSRSRSRDRSKRSRHRTRSRSRDRRRDDKDKDRRASSRDKDRRASSRDKDRRASSRDKDRRDKDKDRSRDKDKDKSRDKDREKEKSSDKAKSKQSPEKTDTGGKEGGSHKAGSPAPSKDRSTKESSRARSRSRSPAPAPAPAKKRSRSRSADRRRGARGSRSSPARRRSRSRSRHRHRRSRSPARRRSRSPGRKKSRSPARKRSRSPRSSRSRTQRSPERDHKRRDRSRDRKRDKEHREKEPKADKPEAKVSRDYDEEEKGFDEDVKKSSSRETSPAKTGAEKEKPDPAGDDDMDISE